MFQPLHSLARVSISLPEELLSALDRLVTRRRLPSRSRAIALMLNRYLGEQQAPASDRPIVGIITLVYRDNLQLQQHVAGLQQKLQTRITSCSSVPLDEEQTLAVLFVQGTANQVKLMGEGLLALREVCYSNTQIVCSPTQDAAGVSVCGPGSEPGGVWAVSPRPGSPVPADSLPSG
jgi:CopG family nickel-responsive transcriptional regulator